MTPKTETEHTQLWSKVYEGTITPKELARLHVLEAVRAILEVGDLVAEQQPVEAFKRTNSDETVAELEALLYPSA